MTIVRDCSPSHEGELRTYTHMLDRMVEGHGQCLRLVRELTTSELKVDCEGRVAMREGLVRGQRRYPRVDRGNKGMGIARTFRSLRTVSRIWICVAESSVAVVRFRE